ncbi:hypothetical protein SCB17_002782 [Clostridium perfringens]|nr:hypothetical protein [Clostridium perfringens]MDU3846295.1 hypothetical protein [Clostridium perfringens]
MINTDTKVSLENKINKVSKLIDDLYNNNSRLGKLQNNEGEITDLGYSIVYLDEIDFTFKCFGELINMLYKLIIQKENFIRFGELKLWFETIEFMGNNYVKQLVERLKCIGINQKKIKISKAAQDMHDLSNRYEYYKRGNREVQITDIISVYLDLNKQCSTLLDSFTFFLKDKKLIDIQKQLLVSKNTENNIIENLKAEGAKLDVEISKLEEYIEKYKFDISPSELYKRLENLRDKFKNLEDKIKDEKRLLLIKESVFRIYEAIHLIRINDEIQARKSYSGIKFYIGEHNVLINFAGLLISSVYDKLSKELQGKINVKRAYFSTIESKKQFRKRYKIMSIDVKEINNFREILFKLRNRFIHERIPYRYFTDPRYQKQVSIYQNNVSVINASYLINLLEQMIESIEI